ncbi:MAG: hypothetical protein J0H64_03425, partial [Actinobacteria bacterium]|nr:hypothetical protein [Actinomycetota bacterium]
MARSVHPPLTGGYLERDGATRLNEAALDAAWAEPGARILRIAGSQVPLRFLSEDRAQLELVAVHGERGGEHAYLGRAGGAPVFALQVQAGDHPAPAAGWLHPFEFGWLLAPLEAE